MPIRYASEAECPAFEEITERQLDAVRRAVQTQLGGDFSRLPKFGGWELFSPSRVPAAAPVLATRAPQPRAIVTASIVPADDAARAIEFSAPDDSWNDPSDED